ncbi:MAG TPA: penicillin-binding protein 2 [Candidatus Saccharimonadales bacterium]|nr:penicillin-binding protein 2 [Candidatus Saccharimonadales bacterium]
MALPNTNSPSQIIKRIRIFYGALVLVVALFGVRLFYVQIIRYDHYKKAALSDQLKQYEIPATRGLISVHDGDSTVPIVLNQKLYTLYADPTYVKDPGKAAEKVASIMGGKPSDYISKLKLKDTRYVVLGKKLNEDQHQKIAALKMPGLGTIAQDYRTYPQGQLAAQLLGFVNDDGKGTYGIEQALNKQLAGTPGQLKAITDANGVPLAASDNNIEKPAVTGDNLVLTVDLTLQKQVEQYVAQASQSTHAQTVNAVVLDPKSGAVKAMANYPTYDPSQYSKVTDASVFNNGTVTNSIEVGSIMKTLTTAAALDQKVISPNTTYYDPGHWKVDGFNITNIEEDGGPGTKSLADLLNLSLNTGATWELMQMGGGDINQKARDNWHNYMVNHYLLGKPTGIEQGYESSGYVPSPAENGAGIDLTYANTAFGQAMTATPLQMASALSAVLNGGTYYQPHLVDSVESADGKSHPTAAKVLASHVVSPAIGKAMVPLMQFVVDHHFIVPPFDQSKYIVGGKTGTAQIAKPGGGYYDNEYNGTYLGFVGGDNVQYVIAVFVVQPHINGYAGTAAAQPLFADIAHMLINNGYVTPKSQ